MSPALLRLFSKFSRKVVNRRRESKDEASENKKYKCNIARATSKCCPTYSPAELEQAPARCAKAIRTSKQHIMRNIKNIIET
jgi:hypothetical protein